jgi:hypothetical protein
VFRATHPKKNEIVDITMPSSSTALIALFLGPLRFIEAPAIRQTVLMSVPGLKRRWHTDLIFIYFE